MCIENTLLMVVILGTRIEGTCNRVFFTSWFIPYLIFFPKGHTIFKIQKEKRNIGSPFLYKHHSLPGIHALK